MNDEVVIVGGGWAGLAAAVELASAGVRVRLLEAANTLGGRARSVTQGSWQGDNGQHLMIGGYHESLRLMAEVNAPLPHRLPLSLPVMGPSGRVWLRAANLPAPLHLLVGLLRSEGLSRGERFAALRFATKMALRRYRLASDMTVETLLRRHQQGERLIQQLWEPLCLGALNTPIAEASAALFLRVIGDSFGRRRADSDLLIPATDLGACFPEPARRYIEGRGGRVETGSRVTTLLAEAGRVTVVTQGGETITSRQLIIATPWWVAQRLFAALPTLAPLSAQLAALQPAPIITLWLDYPETVALDQPLVGLSGTLAQWLFDGGLYGRPGRIAVVISGPGPHESLDREALAGVVVDELRERFPGWPEPLGWQLIRERRATYLATPASARHRPPNQTAIEGLWLAGDYTATGYPATLEGAVRSGVQCAQLLLKQNG